MSEQCKFKVHQFDPVIYPRKVWIIKGKQCKDAINEHFCDVDGNKLIVDGTNGVYACVWGIVRYKDIDKVGVLIWLISEVGVESCAHEAVHAVNKIFCDCDVDYAQEHDEHFAYFVGKVADWMNQVWTGNFKD